MESKTPQFDSLMDEILKNLVPHTRVCKWKGEHQYCEGEFEIAEGDIIFLKMFRVPPPNFCPTCRRIRRFAHMGILRLFKIQCEAPNHTEEMISIFSKECPFPVYDYKYFIGDKFDPFSFGINYTGGSSMEMLLNFRRKFPVPSFLNRDPASINSEYSNGGKDTKNVYYSGGCFYSENVWYSSVVNKSKDVMDSREINAGDHVYSSVASDYIYHSSFIYFSNSCTDSMFLFDCRNCNNCFGSIGLRNAKYVVWNKQVTKEEYEKFMESVYPLSRAKFKEYKEEFWQLVKKARVNASMNVAVENVSGILVLNARNCFDVVSSEKLENLRHSDSCIAIKDSMDIGFSGASNLLYSCVNVGNHSSNVKFSVASKFCTNSEFIFNSKNLDNCFMCFGLQNKSYCVLNKQYTPEEYFKIVDTMKSDMMKRGEYGDGIPMEFSAQSYNFSNGQISFPLSEEEIQKLGGYTAEEPETNVGNTKVLQNSELPETIDKVEDSIVNIAIKCEVTGRPFRVIQSELDFYRKMQLPLPSVHPSVRLDEYLKLIPLGKKYSALCTKCGTDIYSLFDPKEWSGLYCEKCYQQEVY